MSFFSEKEEYKQFEIKEGIAFLIETTNDIFKPIKELDGICQLQEILSSIDELMSDMVVTFPKNGIGIYLYNCTNTGSKFPKNSGMTKIFSLNDLNSSNMKSLANIVRDEADGFKPLRERYPPREEPLDNLQTVLRTMLREFQQKPHYNRTKLLWFTTNDKPYINPQSKDSLRTMISDFEDNKIFIDPIFLDSFFDKEQKQKNPFDLSLYEKIFLNTNFLNRLLQKQKNAYSHDEKSSDDLEDVSSKIKESIHRLREVKRKQFSCDLILSDGPGVGGALGCSIEGYSLFDHEKIKHLKQVYTEGEFLKVVHPNSTLIRADTKEAINGKNENNEATNDKTEKADIIKGFSVKNSNTAGDLKPEGPDDHVVLIPQNVLQYMRGYTFDHIPEFYGKEDADEKFETKYIEDDIEEVGFSKVPYLKLLCFRNLDRFQPCFNLKPALFVTAYLDEGIGATNREGSYTNSKVTFASLYQSCVKLQRYAVVFGCTKLNSMPNLYALYPTNANNDGDTGSTKIPDGFLLISLPWLGEIRSLPDYMLTDTERYFVPNGTSCGPAELVASFKKIINIIGTSGYDPNNHNNPVLQYFYKTIKHEALLIDIKDEDHTLEGNDWSVQRLLELSQRFKKDDELREIALFANRMLNSIGNADVLKRTAEDDKPTSKRQKPRPLSEADIITLWQNDTWQNASVAQLREFIKRYDSIQTASRKAEMVANIVKFLESRRKDKQGMI